jgi:hypothetical protein
MGVTIDKRDEIDSQVVIDFKEALADDERRKAWEPTIGPINTASDSIEGSCLAACCTGQVIRKGFEKDLQMTEDYIKTLVLVPLSEHYLCYYLQGLSKKLQVPWMS